MSCCPGRCLAPQEMIHLRIYKTMSIDLIRFESYGNIRFIRSDSIMSIENIIDPDFFSFDESGEIVKPKSMITYSHNAYYGTMYFEQTVDEIVKQLSSLKKLAVGV